jgi:hypothetical protein
MWSILQFSNRFVSKNYIHIHVLANSFCFTRSVCMKHLFLILTKNLLSFSNVFSLCPRGIKVESKAVSLYHSGAKGDRRYSSYLFLTSALDGDEWSASHSSRALPRGKDSTHPLDRRLGGPQSWSGHRGLFQGPNPGRPVCNQILY